MPFVWQRKDVPEFDAGSQSKGEKCDELGAGDDVNVGNREPDTQKSTTKGKSQRKRGCQSDDEKERNFKKAKKAKTAASAKAEKIKIVAGIDIGTTYSGVSFKANCDSQHAAIHRIMSWPKSTQLLAKMPSTIAYAVENQAYGLGKKRLTKDVIGYEVEPGMVSYTWWKLLLDDRSPRSEFDDLLLDSAVGKGVMRLPSGKTAVDVAADFLRIFLGIIMTEMAKSLTQEVLDNTPILWFVTVPAVWSDQATSNMKAAIGRAGFNDRRMDNFDLVSEPEAAAIATLKEVWDDSPTLLKPGSRVVIADIGGGTIDVEAMRIQKLSPLQLVTIGAGIGGKHGSTAIDRQALRHMQQKYKESLAAVADIKKGPGSQFMNAFEACKRVFAGDLTELLGLPFPALGRQLELDDNPFEDFDEEEHNVIITGAELAGFHDGTIGQTCELIRRKTTEVEQEGKGHIDCVILAGGLSQSTYVAQEIAKRCKESFPASVRFLQPRNAWGAISYGAVQYGLDRNIIANKVARRHYMLIQERAFCEGVDPEHRAVICPIAGKRVRGSLHMLLQKGEIIRGKKLMPGTIVVNDTSPTSLRFSWKIICSDADQPPVWEDDSGCYAVNQIDFDLGPWLQNLIKKGPSSLHHDFAKEPVIATLNITISGGHSAGMMHIQANADRRKVGETKETYSD